MTLIEISQVMGNFGEFFGAILVGVSLFYLAVQVRHSANVTDEANMRAEVERIAGFSKFAAGTPGFMEIFLKAQNGETLSQVERALFNTHMYAMFNEFKINYQLHNRHPGTAPNWETNSRNYISYLLKPGGRNWWVHQKDWLGDNDFTEYVDEQLDKHDCDEK